MDQQTETQDRTVTQSQDPSMFASGNDLYSNPDDPLVAATSLDDSGQSKRPRDARLLHIILASLGVQAYQERVPLQLMDFAYRYTSAVLQDAVHLSSEAYGNNAPGNKTAPAGETGTVTLQSLRLAVASRQHYQFQANLPKEHYQELAADRNRVNLPAVGRTRGIRLPPERFYLTGIGHGLRDDWEDNIVASMNTATSGSALRGTLDRANGALHDDNLMQGIERSDPSEDEEETKDAQSKPST